MVVYYLMWVVVELLDVWEQQGLVDGGLILWDGLQCYVLCLLGSGDLGMNSDSVVLIEPDGRPQYLQRGRQPLCPEVQD